MAPRNNANNTKDHIKTVLQELETQQGRGAGGGYQPSLANAARGVLSIPGKMAEELNWGVADKVKALAKGVAEGAGKVVKSAGGQIAAQATSNAYELPFGGGTMPEIKNNMLKVAGVSTPTPVANTTKPASTASGVVLPIESPVATGQPKSIQPNPIQTGQSPTSIKEPSLSTQLFEVGAKVMDKPSTNTPLPDREQQWTSEDGTRHIYGVGKKAEDPIDKQIGDIETQKLAMEMESRRNHGGKVSAKTAALLAQLTGTQAALRGHGVGAETAKINQAENRAERRFATEETNKYRQEQSAIEREKLKFEIEKFAKTNDMKDPSNFFKLAAAVGRKKKVTSYDADQNPIVEETPDIENGISILEKYGFNNPTGAQANSITVDKTKLPPLSSFKR